MSWKIARPSGVDIFELMRFGCWGWEFSVMNAIIHGVIDDVGYANPSDILAA